MNFNVIKFPSLNKKKEEEVQMVKSISVIFNIANHTSLLAATIYAMGRALCDSELQITLVDIRDNIQDSDHYVWVDAGSPDVLESVLKDRIGSVKRPSEEKKRLQYIRERSDIIESEVVDTPAIGASAYGKVLHNLEAICPEMANESRLRSLTARLWNLGLKFEEPKIDIDDYNLYYGVLRAAYAAYHGERINLESLITTSLHVDRTDEDQKILAFKREQQYIGTLIGRKTRLELIGNTYCYYITAMGPDVYAMIRRIRLSKKPYVHTTMGCYGVVVYTDSPLDTSVALWKETIVLAPEFETKAQAM